MRAKENIYAISHEFYDHPEVFGGGATGKIPFFGSVNKLTTIYAGIKGQ